MPYTNTWSVVIPPGTLPANQIDTAIQQARLDIAQRINDLIGSAGSMSNDPVINGTTAKSLTTLTTELGTKTTLSGLTTGRLIQATGADSIGNATLTNAQLNALYASVFTPVYSLNNIASSGTVYTAPSAGIYLITVNIYMTSAGGMECTLTGGGQTLNLGVIGLPAGSNDVNGSITAIMSLAAAGAVTLSAGAGGIVSSVTSAFRLAAL